MKRGQVSIYVVAGIILLLVAGAGTYIYYNMRSGVIDTDTSPVTEFIDSCLYQTAYNGLKELGRQGRLYPDVYLQSTNHRIAYFYYKGEGHFPTRLTTMEEDMSRYIKENINYCLNDFAAFDFDFRIDESELNVRTEFNQEDMTVELLYPVTIIIGDNEITHDDYNAKVDIDFIPIYELSRGIYEKTKKDPEWMDLTFLSAQPYDIRIVKLTQETILYEITDNDGLEDEPYSYRFAIKFRL